MDSKLLPIFLSCNNECAWGASDHAGTEGVLSEFAELCGLDGTSNSDNDPYRGLLWELLMLITLPRNLNNVFKILNWFRNVDKQFSTMLRGKDAPALLLFAYWP